MSYRVEATDVLDARDAILPIWADNLPIHGPLDEKLRWFYCENPHGRGTGFVLRSPGDLAPIGYAGLGRRTLWYRGEPLRAALFADLAIDRAHRSGLPALALVRAVRQHVLDEHDVGYGFPNAKAAPVYRRAMYRELGAMARYVRVLRSGAYLSRHMPWPRLASSLGGLADRVRGIVDRAQSLRLRRHELVWLADVDARFDRLWEEAREHVPIACERTAAFLRWRFLSQPGEHYRVAALIERISQRVRAYAIVRDAGGAVEIGDLFGASWTTLDILLEQLVPACHALGARALAFRFLGVAEMTELLARHGFSRRAETRPVALAVGSARHGDVTLSDPGAWYLTDLDEET